MEHNPRVFDIREMLLEMPGVVSAELEQTGNVLYAYLKVSDQAQLTEDQVFAQVGLPRRAFCVLMQRIKPTPSVSEAA